MSVSLFYDGSYVTNATYMLPNWGVFSAKLTREAGRRNLVTRRDYFFGGQSIYWYSTEFDLLNRPTNAAGSVSLAREWLYNRRSELAAANVGTNCYGYAYDTIGNRLWSAANAATNSYSANCLNQYASILRASAPPCETVPKYDADGNMTSDGTFSYSYDAENRLLAAYPLSPVVGSLSVENRYDHRHRRVQKLVKQYNGTAWGEKETRTFVWDGMNIVIEKVEFADGTARTFEYFWGMDKSDTEQGAGGVGGLLAVSMDGVFYVPCYDHNGNVVLYVSETGSIAAQYVYDPYGNVVEQSGPLADAFTLGFSTKYHDRETGLVAYQRRFYSPCLGRWPNRDPIEEDGGVNLYGFCGNDAVGRFDRLGLSCKPGTFNVLRLDTWSVPMVNGLASNPDLFNHGKSLLASIGTLGNLISISSISHSALANFQSFVDAMVGKALSPDGDALAMLRRLYEELRRGPAVVRGELRYELCVCRGGKTKFVEQDPINDEECVIDGSDDDEISRVRNTLIRHMISEMYRNLK